jgi:hypothetical protein
VTLGTLMRTLVAAAAATLALAPAAAAADAPAGGRVSYSKEFPGSVPPYVGIIVERNGEAVYKDSPTDENPLKFRLSDKEVAAIYELAGKLGKFTRQVESNLKVARMGAKTFYWDEGDTHNKVQFNYSLDPDAQALADWFERIIETEQAFLILDRSVRFDKLGVNRSLLIMQMSMERNRLVAVEQFLPLLDRVVKNDSFMHMSRERAAALAEQIREPEKAAAKKAEPGNSQ